MAYEQYLDASDDADFSARGEVTATSRQPPPIAVILSYTV